MTGDVVSSIDDIVGPAAREPGNQADDPAAADPRRRAVGGDDGDQHRPDPGFPSVVDHFDADDVVRAIEREKVLSVTVVGDAMARPLIAAIRKGGADVSSLMVVANGGALLTPYVKQQLIETLPGAIVIDGVGSSETGAQMRHMSTSGAVSTGTFTAGPDTCVVAEDLGAVLEPGHDGSGLAGSARLCPAGLQGRCHQDRGDVPGHRRCAVRGSRRPGPAPGGRVDRAARPGFGDDQLRRGEDLRRGGRDGDRLASGGRRRGGRRPAQRTLGPGGGRGGGAGRRRRVDAAELIEHAAGHWPATSCPRRWCSGP